MKLLRGAIILLAAAFLASAAQQANATVYSDNSGNANSGGDVNVSSNYFDHLDITSVEVNNNATDLIFKINLAGNPVATDWGKYMVGIDSTAGGDTTNNGWGRPISMSSGMDYWIGSWADSGNGIENRNWTNPGWPLIAASYGPNPANVSFSKDSSSVTLTVKLADWGLSVGNSFDFDVYASGGGGGDGAVDALANPSQTIVNWGDSYNSALKDTYTVVPEPSTLVLVAFGGLALIGRLFRRRA